MEPHNEIERALQQPASADVEREARELLASKYEQASLNQDAAYIRNGGNGNRTTGDTHIRMAIRAITAALRKQQQEAEPVAARDLRTAMQTVIENLNNATAIMRDKPFGGAPDRHWLTNQVNILRAALTAALAKE